MWLTQAYNCVSDGSAGGLGFYLTRRRSLAHRDRRRLDRQPSLSGHCGHEAILGAQRSVANDPKETFAWHRIAIVRVTTRLLSISVSDSLPDHGPPFLRIGFYRSAEPHWVGPLTFSNTTIVRPSRPSTLLLKGAVVMVRVFPSSL